MRKFYLGAHQPGWLWSRDDARVPLFVSFSTLSTYKSFRPAVGSWALDSGAFSQLSRFGRWTVSEHDYLKAVARYQADIGYMDFASPQDWMCEPDIIRHTGLSVRVHQSATVANYITLTSLWPEFSDQSCPIIPVLQGWKIDDYLTCVELYESEGIHLETCGLVGVGSVCRRQHTGEIGEIFRQLRHLPLHGFGVKIRGIERYGHYLETADSMAWSYQARNQPPLTGHYARHQNCANCQEYALNWYYQVTNSPDFQEWTFHDFNPQSIRYRSGRGQVCWHCDGEVEAGLCVSGC